MSKPHRPPALLASRSPNSSCPHHPFLQQKGNVLKIDRHKYVKVGYHSFRKLSPTERATRYNSAAVRESFDEPMYGMIDTLFSLAEAYLYMQLVGLKEDAPEDDPFWASKSYEKLYKEVGGG